MASTLSILILTCSLCITSVLALQFPDNDALNISSPALANLEDGEDDPHFAMQVIYGVTDIPVTPVYMNVVELMAQYAEMEFLGRAGQRSGFVLPGFPQVEIALIPAPPATTVEVRLIIWALYGAVLDMTVRNRFKENEVPFSWDGNIVGYLYFTIPEDSILGWGNRTANMQLTDIANSTNLTTSSSNTSTFNTLGIGQFDWTPVYRPDGQIIPPKDVFILTMGILKTVARHAVTDKVRWPFHVSSDMVNAHAEIFLPGDGAPRSRPPYFQYGHIVEAARRTPGWMLEERKFADLWAGIKSNSRTVGLLLLLKGPYQPGLTQVNDGVVASF